MSLTPYEDFLPLIQPHVPGAPIPAILSSIQRVVSDFCIQSTAYRYRIEGVPAIANVPYYDLTTPAHTRVASVVSAMYQGRLLKPTSDVLVGPNLPSGEPHSFIEEAGRIRVLNTPTQTIPGAFNFQVALRPTSTAPGISEAFADRFYHDISLGVLADLLMAAHQPWGNPGASREYGVQYGMRIMDAKARANSDHTAKVRTTSINWF